MPRLIIILNEQERKALNELSERESRDPRSQGAVIIRQELERLGLIAAGEEKWPVESELEKDSG
jgi:hypothetical protein